MRNPIIKAALATMLAGVWAFPASGAEHLDCMDAQMGEAEQKALGRLREAKRADDKLSLAVQVSLESRAQVCAQLNGWSESARNLAFSYKWNKLQSERFPYLFDAAQESRLKAALQPMRSRLIVLFDPSVRALMLGQDPPPPEMGDARFQVFYSLLGKANIKQNKSNERLLESWIYWHGYAAAIVDAFSKQ